MRDQTVSRNLPPLSHLRDRYLVQGRSVPRAVEAALQADDRPGAQAILRALVRRRHKNRQEGQRQRRMTRYERVVWDQGFLHVAGVDEAGMAPLAGPVVAAAVILAPGERLPGVDDSKKLSAEQRRVSRVLVDERALAIGIGQADPTEIDTINIYHAGLLAMQRAVSALSPAADYLLIDGRALATCPLPQERIVKGDQKSLSIAAASIVAKTTRDALMVELDEAYPGYGFAQHKGYPVQAHVDALCRLGVTPHHRRSFAPVQQALLSGVRPQGGRTRTRAVSRVGQKRP